MDARDEVADSVSVHATGGQAADDRRARGVEAAGRGDRYRALRARPGGDRPARRHRPRRRRRRTDRLEPSVRDRRQLVLRRGGVQPGSRASCRRIVRRCVSAGQRVGHRVHAGMAGAEHAPPAFVTRFRSPAWMARDGIGDIALNYRYQLLEEGPGRPAMAPRLSLLDAERRSVARPGRQRLGPAGEPAGQQAGPRFLLPRQRGILVEAERGFRCVPVGVARAGTGRHARSRRSSAAARSIACARW